MGIGNFWMLLVGLNNGNLEPYSVYLVSSRRVLTICGNLDSAKGFYFYFSLSRSVSFYQDQEASLFDRSLSFSFLLNSINSSSISSNFWLMLLYNGFLVLSPPPPNLSLVLRSSISFGFSTFRLSGIITMLLFSLHS
jgi:hypothetical protein